jgi:hypothetical protein
LLDPVSIAETTADPEPIRNRPWPEPRPKRPKHRQTPFFHRRLPPAAPAQSKKRAAKAAPAGKSEAPLAAKKQALAAGMLGANAGTALALTDADLDLLLEQ